MNIETLATKFLNKIAKKGRKASAFGGLFVGIALGICFLTPESYNYDLGFDFVAKTLSISILGFGGLLLILRGGKDWDITMVDDARKYFWLVNSEGEEVFIRFAKTKAALFGSTGDYYENKIYRQRFLPKWVYSVDSYTMICVDAHINGGRFLQIFDNSKKMTSDNKKEEKNHVY